ncbi:MAG: DUF1080 domain-containing protein [Planctomycetales bacterium]
MKTKIFVLALVITCICHVGFAEDGFTPIFDGKTLDGWSAPDMRYWSVEDGAITARSSEELPCTRNQFLVWQLGDVDDFELKLKFRILGTDSANSGIQIRSQFDDSGHAIGYQADIDRAGQWLGVLYDEHGRGVLAKRGERTTIDEQGKRVTSGLKPEQPDVDLDNWNEYQIIARGPQITLKINGVTTAEVVDQEAGQRDLWGKLALQIHSGAPLTVQFKDIQFKRLPLTEGRKKIAVLAGGLSHPSGQHEFNAGVKLLSSRLKENDGVVVANYHDNGWPADPTAMDNVDAIVVYADGLTSHPLRDHLEETNELMRQGVGLMCMHYAVHVEPGVAGDHFKRWIGGHYESDFSTNPMWNAELKANPQHPVSRGAAKDETINDEWYFSIRFADESKNVTSLLSAVPSKETRSMNGWPRKAYPHIIADGGKSETLMWAIERTDGGRGVGFTGGHWHHNWGSDLQRNTVLAAMLWVAGVEVPAEGVASRAVSEEELNVNLDPKQNQVRVRLPDNPQPQ